MRRSGRSLSGWLRRRFQLPGLFVGEQWSCESGQFFILALVSVLEESMTYGVRATAVSVHIVCADTTTSFGVTPWPRCFRIFATRCGNC
jgi:hypothetical protein